jgi:hypothetical protein
MNLIPKYKIADCDRCGDKNTECRKRAKLHLCLNCCKVEDVERQKEKAKLRDTMHRLRNEQGGDNAEIADMQVIKNELDVIFSRIVRLSACGEDLYLKCYTCPPNAPKIHFSMAQNSHFVKRNNTLLRWDKRNCRPACKTCNEVKEGNLEVYAANLDKESPGLSEQLIQEGREVHKWTREELIQLRTQFRIQLRELKKLKLKK